MMHRNYSISIVPHVAFKVIDEFSERKIEYELFFILNHFCTRRSPESLMRSSIAGSEVERR
jgi:hypothetical protein